ncbi:MAG: response regulator [Rhodoferax sp.]|nr:response regulator [Rhodoferax sp.]
MRSGIRAGSSGATGPVQADYTHSLMVQVTAEFSKARALVIDGSPMSRAILVSQVRDFGFEKVVQCTRLAEARDYFTESSFDVVLCEHYFANESPTGLDFVDELRGKQLLPLSTVVFMVTGESSYARVAEAAEAALDGYLLKPHKANQLHERLRLACYRKESFREVYNHIDSHQFDVAAEICLERYHQRGLFWLYAARIGAELLMRIERFKEAQELYEAIAAANTLPWAKLGVARALMESGNAVEAANALGALLEEDPNYADAYDVLARAQFELGDVDQARATYKMACNMTPDSVGRVQALGMMTYYAGDMQEAAELLDRAARIGLDSKMFDCQTLVALAFTQLDLKDHRGLQRCRDNFTRLLERNPGSLRHERGVAIIDALLALMKNETARLLGMVREMTTAARQPGFDFEAGSNLMALLTRTALRELRVNEAERHVDELAMRFCTSRPITDILAGAATAHAPYADRVRKAGHQVQKIAQNAVTLAMMGDPSLAVRQLTVEGANTLNSKLIDAAHHIVQRYQEKISDHAFLSAKVQELRNQYGARSRTQVPASSGRQPGGLALRMDSGTG